MPQHTFYTIVSCNGYIQLDSFPTNLFINILGGTSNNRIAALGADLKHSNSNASLQYTTIGTAPDRVCIIQWLHYSYFGGMTGDLNFQIVCMKHPIASVLFMVQIPILPIAFKHRLD
ncbi:MAG: hypothetical protein IPP46_18290 [Bacteroidetes bacterium]|nr:hypothetical protein [Bacteroidota bacterium]